MSKKIVVLTGSPRRNGNSFAMTGAFIKAAEKKGHTVTRFDAAFFHKKRKKAPVFPNFEGCFPIPGSVKMVTKR